MLWVASTATAVPDTVAEAATDEVKESRTEEGSGYDVLSKLAQGVFPKIACPHFVKPDGLRGLAYFHNSFLLLCNGMEAYQHTGSMSTMSFGHIVNGFRLNMEMIPVGVGAAVVLMLVAGLCEVDVETAVSMLREGQHSGRSSEHPISGTSMKLPSA